MSKFSEYRKPHEVLDAVIDGWCDRECLSRQEKGFPFVSKLDLKNELGKAVGLGNGDCDNSAGKGIYRYCSGETPISVEKALLICRYIDNYDFISWIGFQSGMMMTPRAAVESVGELGEEELFGEIVDCLINAGDLTKILSRAYNAAASFNSLREIEEAFRKSILQMERTRLLLTELIERSLKPGTQGKFWAGPEPIKGKKSK